MPSGKPLDNSMVRRIVAAVRVGDSSASEVARAYGVCVETVLKYCHEAGVSTLSKRRALEQSMVRTPVMRPKKRRSE